MVNWYWIFWMTLSYYAYIINIYGIIGNNVNTAPRVRVGFTLNPDTPISRKVNE